MVLKLVLVVIIIGVLFLVGFNDRPEVSVYAVQSDKVKGSVRICVLSDLHSAKYGTDIADLVDEYKPDVLVLPGDIFEAKYGLKNADDVIDSISSYPFYYVTGNHECRCEIEDEAKEHIRARGGIVLEGTKEYLEVNGNKIQLLGLDDLNVRQQDYGDQVIHVRKYVDADCYSVLVSHEPQLIDIYESGTWDMVISGHAHGGQWRYKGKGFFAPQQGLFPRYTEGVHTLGNGSRLVISRGLCKSYPWAPRWFNRPEIVMVDIEGIQ